MHAEIIAVGTELTTGAKLDTNSQWLSLELAGIGIPVKYHTTVADDLEAMTGELRTAVDRSDLVLLTGGLGPTLDDLTRQALAELTQSELVLDEPSLKFIQTLFARRNREMPERNVIQAMFPAGSRPLPNSCGTAPGIWMEVARAGRETACLIAAMPGVPSEMKRMFQREVLPRLPGGQQVIQSARINCFGVGESDAEQLLGDLTARGRDPEVGITAHEATITLRITAQGRTADECTASIAATQTVIRQRMGELVFGEEDDELEHVVLRLLNQQGRTLATAESGTGGLLAHRLTAVAGLDAAYLGGVVAPTDAAKCHLLGLDRGLLERAGPISAETAAAMAAGCRDRFGTDFALSITECPRCDPDDASAAARVLFTALAGDRLSEVQPHTVFGDPALTRSRAAKAALNLLRLHLVRG